MDDLIFTPAVRRVAGDVARALPEDVAKGYLDGAKWLRQWFADTGRGDVPIAGTFGTRGAVAVRAVHMCCSPATERALQARFEARQALEQRAYALGFSANYVWNACTEALLAAVEDAEQAPA